MLASSGNCSMPSEVWHPRIPCEKAPVLSSEARRLPSSAQRCRSAGDGGRTFNYSGVTDEMEWRALLITPE